MFTLTMGRREPELEVGQEAAVLDVARDGHPTV
jgi:hypothetical protein